MAKIFYNRYKDDVANGKMTVDEVIALVPTKWKDAVKALFDEAV